MNEQEDKTVADRTAERAGFLICAINLLFFAIFMLTVFQVTTAISGEQPAAAIACTGENLVAKLADENPGKLREAEKQAEALPNGKAILWQVTRAGTPISYLFGTMHSADPRIAKLEDAARKAFDESGTVLIESTETLEAGDMAQTMMGLRELTLLMDGSLLEQSVAGDRLEALQAAVESRGMPWKIANHMQPWLVAAAIAAPDCELDAKKSGLPVLDTLIGHEARVAGKTLIGLETVEEQFAAIASIPREFHINALNETLRLYHLLNDMHETTKQLYLDGNMGLVLPLARAYAPEVYRGRGHAEFQERVLVKRNRLMAERAAEHLDGGKVFMAVGALHLPGEDGLVELLRQRGFTVEPVSG